MYKFCNYANWSAGKDKTWRRWNLFGYQMWSVPFQTIPNNLSWWQSITQIQLYLIRLSFQISEVHTCTVIDHQWHWTGRTCWRLWHSLSLEEIQICTFRLTSTLSNWLLCPVVLLSQMLQDAGDCCFCRCFLCVC